MSGNNKERSSINNSTAKSMYAFSKDARFKVPRANSCAFGYEIPGQFGHKTDSGAGKGFGSSVKDRFGYEALRKTKRDEGSLDGHPDMDTKRSTAKYSFGVSRSAMKKLHVDEILKKGDVNNPGPERYLNNKFFGNKQGQLECDSKQYTMRKKLGAFERHLAREAKLPGPGSY